MMRIIILILIASGLAWQMQSTTRREEPSQLIIRSRVSDGNLGRLQRVLAKAQRGEPVTIGFIGGSITWGQDATSHDLNYAEQVTRWWADQFPLSKVTMVNAGARGTGSNYGCLRAQRDLLAHRPDFVVVEFGVNDRDDLAHAQTFEGVVRQLMADPAHPAVVLLFMMHSDGTNAQGSEREIGWRYQVPMISFRDAMWPEITAGRIRHSDLYADSVHPNDCGHAMIANFINSLLHDAKNAPIKPLDGSLPAPRFSNLFSKTRLLEAADLHPLCCDGWTYDSDMGCWLSTRPGSEIEFEMSGRLINLLYGQISTRGGTVSVSIDGGPPILSDAWFDGTWEGHCQTDTVGRDLSPGLHRLHIRLLNESNSLSSGHEFQIWGLGSAGN